MGHQGTGAEGPGRATCVRGGDERKIGEMIPEIPKISLLKRIKNKLSAYLFVEYRIRTRPVFHEVKALEVWEEVLLG